MADEMKLEDHQLSVIVAAILTAGSVAGEDRGEPARYVWRRYREFLKLIADDGLHLG